MPKSFLAAIFAFILFATLVGVMEQKKRCRKADIQWLQELATRQREESCASHIGKLTGAKHDAALKWLWSFSFAGKRSLAIEWRSSVQATNSKRRLKLCAPINCTT